MITRLFVTGTDSDVGKTVVARALMQAFIAQGKSVAGYKPIATCCTNDNTGNLVNKDALILQAASMPILSYQEVNPIACQEEALHVYKGEISYQKMSSGLSQLAEKTEIVIVEGTGGWKVLMNDYRPYSQWVIKEKLPVVLVVGIKQGCISHALLTMQAIMADGLTLLGWIANRINPCLANYAQTITALQQSINAPLLGELPYLSRIEQHDLGRYVTITSLLK